MAVEVRSGTPKKDFLKQCENLMEYLIYRKRQGPSSQDARPNSWRSFQRRFRADGRNNGSLPIFPLLKDILREVICVSITESREPASSENIKEALNLLVHIYNKLGRGEIHSSLVVTIGHCMQEIAIVALEREDQAATMEAVEKIAEIEGRYQELYIVANKALFWYNRPEPAVAAVRKLESAIREEKALVTQSKIIPWWLGLLANLHNKGGSAAEFAERQLHKFGPALTPEVFERTYKHFAKRMGFFDTADAVRKLQNTWFAS